MPVQSLLNMNIGTVAADEACVILLVSGLAGATPVELTPAESAM